MFKIKFWNFIFTITFCGVLLYSGSKAGAVQPTAIAVKTKAPDDMVDEFRDLVQATKYKAAQTFLAGLMQTYPDDHRLVDAKVYVDNLISANKTVTTTKKPTSDDAATYVESGESKRTKGDLDGAIADHTKAIELKPDDVSAYYYRAIAKRVKGDFDGVIADSTKAIELGPDDAFAHILRGSAKEARGDLDSANADYTKTIELKPDLAIGYQMRAYLRYHRRAWTDALVDFAKVAELDAADDSSQFRLWLLRTRLGELEAANQKLTAHLAARKPGKAPDWELSVGRYLTGQLAEREFLAAAKNADSKTEVVQLCGAYFYAGSKHLFAGDKATAMDYFQKSIAKAEQRAFFEYNSAAAELKFLKAQ